MSESGFVDLTGLTQKSGMKLRGSEISMIFQEPMTALNPLIKVGKQVCECLLTHQRAYVKKRQRALS